MYQTQATSLTEQISDSSCRFAEPWLPTIRRKSNALLLRHPRTSSSPVTENPSSPSAVASAGNRVEPRQRSGPSLLLFFSGCTRQNQYYPCLISRLFSLYCLLFSLLLSGTNAGTTQKKQSFSSAGRFWHALPPSNDHFSSYPRSPLTRKPMASTPNVQPSSNAPPRSTNSGLKTIFLQEQNAANGGWQC